MLSDADKAAIAAAVQVAERATSGEVFCLITQEVSAYPETPLAAGIIAALVGPPLLIAAGLDPASLATAGEWTAAHGAAPDIVGGVLGAYAAAQAALFAVAAGLAAVPAVRRALTPGFVKAAKVRRLARQLFAATGMPGDPQRTGVMIFASLHDRRVEILADAAIHAQAPAGAWDQAVRAIREGMRAKSPAEGFTRAIALVAAPLAQAFPAQGPDPNRLPDTPTEL